MIAHRFFSLLSHSSRTALAIFGSMATIALVGAAKPESAAPSRMPVSSASVEIQHGGQQNSGPQTAALVVDSDRELLQETSTAAREPETAVAKDLTPGIQSHKKVVWMTVTAYCGCTKCCGPKARGLTASGRSIAYNGGHFVAADTRLFKFGTQIQIPGYAGGQPVEVIDRGSAIKGYHIDLFFPTHQQAREWGNRWMAVTILE